MIKPIILCTAIIAVIPFAQAQTKTEKKLAEASITLQQAIDIAEKETGGIAYEAEIERNSFNVEYEIELLVSGKKYEVTIDAKTAEVISAREDK